MLLRGYEMIRDIYKDYTILQTGFWRIEIDLARPRLVSLRADSGGLIDYCQEILEPGFGGESLAQIGDITVRSRDSIGHKIDHDGKTLCVKGIRMGDFAVLDWKISMGGPRGEILQVEVTREIVKSVSLATDVPFGFQCLREFAFWSRPSLRFGHDPADPYVTDYAAFEERSKRRVIGYHPAIDAPFLIHGSPSYPDFEMSLSAGYHHLEQHYCRHVTFGLSSRDFSSGEMIIPVGKETWLLQLKPVPQGKSAPVGFHSGHEAMNKFVPEFFDGYLLSAVACDHEYFGNNPYRHAYAPGAIHFVTRGFLVTDRRSWHKTEGDMEERWKRHIRRTLTEGRISRERLIIILDSGVWQDKCGAAGHDEHGTLVHGACFVTSCCHILLKSGDKVLAEEISDELDAIIGKVTLFDPDNDGLLESPQPGTPGSPSTSYNDCLSEGHKDGYLNAVACEAFSLYASLLEFLGKREKAAKYRLLAQKIIEAYNEQLWDDQKERYVAWIDVNGVSHDAWYTHVNFPAVVAGMVPENRLRRMMRSFINHPNHHRIFAAGVNLDPVVDGSMHGGLEFGIWLNGGVLLGPASMELYARALGLGGEGAWDMLKDLLVVWNRNRLAQTPFRDWCRPKPLLYDKRLTYTGGNAWTWVDGKDATAAGTEPYLADGGAILWALYTGVLGIRPDFQGISFVPHLPQALADTEVKIRLMGKNIGIRTRGYGDKMKSMALNGKNISGNRLAWDHIQEGSTIDVEVT